MVGGVSEVKRPTPPGAKDLGLTDEVFCWICPKCGHTSTDHLCFCNCGGLTLDCSEARSEDFPTASDFGVYGYLRSQTRTYEDGETDSSYCCNRCVKCVGCRKEINDDTFIEVLNTHEKEKYIDYEWYYFHDDCHLEFEKDRLDKIKQNRIKNGLCVACGNAIGLMDKLSGREKHKSC